MDSSNFWKLDKIDKIGIALIFIIFALYSTFSCFATENDVITYSEEFNDLSISFNGLIVSQTGSSILSFDIEPGYRYTITNNDNGDRACGFLDSPEQVVAGTYVDNFTNLQGNTSFSFNSSQYGKLYVVRASTSAKIIVTREELPGMEGSVDLLSGYVGFNVWESFSNTIVYALPITITCFGIYIICGFVQKFSKGA